MWIIETNRTFQNLPCGMWHGSALMNALEIPRGLYRSSNLLPPEPKLKVAAACHFAQRSTTYAGRPRL
jgi:hypothetical protein